MVGPAREGTLFSFRGGFGSAGAVSLSSLLLCLPAKVGVGLRVRVLVGRGI